MTVTFLNGVNASLKRARVIEGDSQALATSTVTSTSTGLTATEAFTDASRQNQIDVMLQCWQEAIDGVFSFGLQAREAATGSLSLTSGGREYALATDFLRLAGMTYETRVFRGATTGLVLYEYPGGYAQMLADQARATDWTGDPTAYAISPVSDQTVRMDREGTADQASDTYYYLYDKMVLLTSTMATTPLPFSDTVANSLVPVVADMWGFVYKRDPATFVLQTSLTRAIELSGQNQRRSSWGPKRISYRL